MQELQLSFRVCRMVTVLFIVPVLFLLGSCTVFENREHCPNYFTVDFTEVDNTIKEWQMWLLGSDGEVLFKDTIYRRSYSQPYTVEVPRSRNVKCLLWGNIRKSTLLNEVYSSGTYFTKLKDVSADSLYSFTDIISTMEEDSYVKVKPQKEFATVDIYIKGWVGSDYEANMVLACASSGFYIGKEFREEMSYTKVAVYEIGHTYTHFRCRMLRQPDTENLILKLHIRELDDNGSLGDVIADREIPIGEYLYANGYDMQKESLDDIEMELDYTYNEFVIRTSDWNAVYQIKGEI